MSNRFHDFTENFYALKNNNPWSYGCFHSMAALIYALKNKTYDKETFLTVKKEFQTQIGWTALFNASTDDLLFALLSTNNEKGPALMATLTDQSKSLKNTMKFPSAQIHYCLYQLSRFNEADRIMILKRTKETYDQIKRNHPVISSPNDLPLYVSLLIKMQNTADAVSTIERIYNELVAQGFKKSNGLLSASISLSELPYSPSTIGERGKSILGTLKSMKLPISTDIYLFLPILMQREVHSTLTFEKLNDTFKEIKETKSVKWLSKAEKFLIATSLNMMDLNRQGQDSDNTMDIYNVTETILFVYYFKIVQMTNAAVATS
jgi:hypothetical protein